MKATDFDLGVEVRLKTGGVNMIVIGYPTFPINKTSKFPVNVLCKWIDENKNECIKTFHVDLLEYTF